MKWFSSYFILVWALVLPAVFGIKCEDSAFPPSTGEVLDEYIIDLDVAPELRWKELIQDKAILLKDLFQDVKELIQFVVGERLFNILESFLPKIADSLPNPYSAEIDGMATASGIPVAHLTLYNIFYEMFILCTSIVVEDADGHIYHGRNLDNGALLGWNSSSDSWKVTEKLKPLTVGLEWRRDGRAVFRSVNFAGYVGVLTAVKKDSFSFSLNKRFSFNNGLVGLFEWLLLEDRHQHWVSFLPREVMESASDFESAKAALALPRLVAPVYYILAGVEAGQGVIISRDRDNANLLPLGAASTPWHLVETNYDHWKSPPFYDDRRTPSVTCLEEGGSANASLALLYNVLSTRPVLNKSTVYTALMRAATGELRAWQRECPDPCFPW